MSDHAELREACVTKELVIDVWRQNVAALLDDFDKAKAERDIAVKACVYEGDDDSGTWLVINRPLGRYPTREAAVEALLNPTERK